MKNEKLLEEIQKARARSRGLVMANVQGFDAAIGVARKFYEDQLAATQGLASPNDIPRFFDDSSHAGIWKSPTRYRFHDGAWQSFPPSAGDPDGDPTEMIGESYDKVMPNWFESWTSFRESFGEIDPITFDLSDIANEVRDMIGAVGLSRDEWQPGRMNWENFKEAIDSVDIHAIVNWNVIVASVPAPPPLISLEPYEETTHPNPFNGSPASITLYRPESHSIEANNADNKFIFARDAWELWIELVQVAHEGLARVQGTLSANGPLLDAAQSALKTFKRGSQYKFRGK